MERTFDAVLFDLDGTLVDSTPAVVRSWLRWAGEEGVEPERLRGSHGQTARSIVARLVAADRVEGALGRIIALEEGDVDGVIVLPGAAAALAVLPPSRVAIVTSGSRTIATARITAAGLAWPTVLITADDVRRGKPDPEPFLLGAERLRVDPRRCLVVEDAPAGLAAAQAAGCTTLAVGTTHRLEELDADLRVPDLGHVRFRLEGGALAVAVDATG